LLRQLADKRAQQRPLGLPPLQHDELALLGRREELGVDSVRHELVAAREADGGCIRDLLARREQRVDAGEQPLALGAAGRVTEPLGRKEGRRGERRGIAEREVREARQPRLEAVHDVEPSAGEREREARADADRHAHPAAPGNRHGRAERDQLGIVEIAEQRAPPRREIAGAVRRGEDGHRVVAPPQLAGEPVHVLVHVVRLRPGEGRDERDPHAFESSARPVRAASRAGGRRSQLRAIEAPARPRRPPAG
jgi:hypothetical protein